jgi:hypothetical protein
MQGEISAGNPIAILNKASDLERSEGRVCPNDQDDQGGGHECVLIMLQLRRTRYRPNNKRGAPRRMSPRELRGSDRETPGSSIEEARPAGEGAQMDGGPEYARLVEADPKEAVKEEAAK